MWIVPELSFSGLVLISDGRRNRMTSGIWRLRSPPATNLEMKTMRATNLDINTKRLLLMFAIAVVAVAVFAASASAKTNGHRDADKDGATNRCEIQAKTDPNNVDTDANGVVDGDEDTDGDGATNRAESNLRSNCGRANSHLRIRRATVTSYLDGVLVLTVKGGGTVTAPVADPFRCAARTKTFKPNPSKSKAKGPKASKSKARYRNSRCAEGDLIAGAKVHKARTKGGKFVEVTVLN